MPKDSKAQPNRLVPVIAGRLLDHLQRGEYGVGARLTEQALADTLGVSRSPVRKALCHLEALGAVRSHPNRGFSVAKTVAQLQKIDLPIDTESDEASYMRLVDDRLAGVIADEVSESELMERYGLTRLQIQRVLNRLARENLALRKPGRGWIFMPVLSDASAHRDSYRFRMIIEPAALLEPTFRVNKQLLDSVRREQHQLLDGGIERWSAAERFRAGANFHEAIVACSGNRLLLDALRTVNQLRRLIEYHSQTGSRKDQERLRRQCEEHLALLDLIEAGERMEAAHLLRQHLNVVGVIKTSGEPLDMGVPTGKTRRSQAGVRSHL